jgi:hypothetical protein
LVGALEVLGPSVVDGVTDVLNDHASTSQFAAGPD